MIMTFEQMDDYDKFKQQQFEKEYSYLKNVGLLELFHQRKVDLLKLYILKNYKKVYINKIIHVKNMVLMLMV